MKAASLCVVVIALSLCPSAVGADKKQFSKKESGRIIEAAIRKELNKPNGEITKADLWKVTRLNLSFTKTTDASLKELAKLKNLTELGLAGTQIMDAGFKMKMLTKLRKLSWLGLKDTRVTRAGVAELQKMLPKCEIISNATK